MKLSTLFIPAALLLPSVHAWGDEGHGIVAVIAQMNLQPNVLSTVCDILGQSRCHLASVASWADQIKGRMKWSSALHYVNPVDDHPSQRCIFPGVRGWDGQLHINILDAVKNVTNVLQRWVDREVSDGAAEEALKFLVHFVGDMHQPLHLTGREQGGNKVEVEFNGRKKSLHSVWDNTLIEKFIRNTPAKYNRPSSNRRLEAALGGESYDPYIRRIVLEGVLGTWRNEVNSWVTCGATAGTDSTQVAITGVDINPDGPVVCPYYWARPIHQLNCDIAWPKALDDGDDELLELDTPEYAGAIERRWIIEKLLAQGGFRLAGILNDVFGQE